MSLYLINILKLPPIYAVVLWLSSLQGQGLAQTGLLIFLVPLYLTKLELFWFWFVFFLGFILDNQLISPSPSAFFLLFAVISDLS